MKRYWFWVVSLLCLVCVWGAPVPARVDIGRFDSAVVAGFYPVEYGAGTSFRWTMPQASLHLAGINGGTATLQLNASARSPLTVEILMDGTVVPLVIQPGFARYDVPLTLPYALSGERTVVLHVANPDNDGRRDLGIALDDVRIIPAGWNWPPLGMVLLSLAAIWLLSLLTRDSGVRLPWRVVAATGAVAVGILARRGDAPAILTVTALAGALIAAVIHAQWATLRRRRLLAICTVAIVASLLVWRGALVWQPLWQSSLLIGSVAFFRLRRMLWRVLRPYRQWLAVFLLVMIASQSWQLAIGAIVMGIIVYFGHTADPCRTRGWAVLWAAYSIVPTVDAWLCGRGIRRGTAQALSRSVGLDYLRGLVVLFVLLAHTPTLAVYGNEWVVTIVHWLVKFAVEAFFVLSGWLIGDLIVTELATWTQPRALALFLHRRWARTLPIYWLVLALVVLAGWSGATLTTIGTYLVFVQNFWSIHPPYFLVAWSLSIEEWFYMLAAIVLSITAIWVRPQRALLGTLVLLIGVPLVLRSWLSVSTDWSWTDAIRQFVPLRLDAIASGVALVWAWRRWPFVARYKWVWLGGSVVLASGFIAAVQIFQPNWEHTPWVRVSIIPVMSVGILGLFPFLAALQRPQPGSIERWLRWISMLSYPLYLLHYPIRQTVVGLTGVVGANVVIDVLVTVVFYVGSFWLALCWNRELEQPIMRLRQRS